MKSQLRRPLVVLFLLLAASQCVVGGFPDPLTRATEGLPRGEFGSHCLASHFAGDLRSADRGGRETAPQLGKTAPQRKADAAQPLVLNAESFRHHVDRFNKDDEELYVNAVPNAAAWEFLKSNIPLFECPDEEIERTYYFRFWTYRKHLKETPDGWVVTEFLLADRRPR